MPFWLNFYGATGFWFSNGKPFGEALLICFGISTVEMFSVYFGFWGFRILIGKGFSWIKKQLTKGVKISVSEKQLLFVRTMKKRSGYDSLNHFTSHRKQKFLGWLSKRGTIPLLAIILAPVPYTDLSATAVLGARKLKYGHWYIAAVNVPHIFGIVLAEYFGIDFFLSWFS
ncbi:MAG: hypothetical protein ABIA08_00270 [bacterium]